MLNANVGVSYKGPAQNAQIGKNDLKWVQNNRQVLRIGPRESYGSSGVFGTGLIHSFFFLGHRWGENLRPPCFLRRLPYAGELVARSHDVVGWLLK